MTKSGLGGCSAGGRAQRGVGEAMTDPLDSIYNYRRLGQMLATAGQPTARQLNVIAHEGFEVVINLGLAGQAYSLADERERVESLGLEYVHIPVAWKRPEAHDLDRFIEVMRTLEGRSVFVHCAANKRVSVFVALYRIAVLGCSYEDAMNALRTVWVPDSVWRRFLDAQLSRLGP